MRVFRPLCLVASVGLALFGCGGHEPPPETPSPPPASDDGAVALDAPDAPQAPTSSPLNEPAPATTKLAKDALLGDGNTYMFSLDDSPDALKLVEAACAKSQKRNEKKRAACMHKAKAEAASEGIRIEKQAGGRWRWVLFGAERGREVVNQRFTFTVQADDPTKVVLAPEGRDDGKRPLKSLPKALEVEVPDEATIVMNDARKGRLVFKKNPVATGT